MSGVLCSFVGASFGGRPELGDVYEGGYFGGQINDGGTIYDLVVAPKASGFTTTNNEYSGSASTSSRTDGPSNTSSMASLGAPGASFCNNLTIGGYSDWYMPAQDELEVLYYNLKPSTDSNNTSVGTNTNAVPPRNSNYTSGDPAQTSVLIFQGTNAEAFTAGTSPFYHASSTSEITDNTFWAKDFRTGLENGSAKASTVFVRAIRRVAA